MEELTFQSSWPGQGVEQWRIKKESFDKDIAIDNLKKKVRSLNHNLLQLQDQNRLLMDSSTKQSSENKLLREEIVNLRERKARLDSNDLFRSESLKKKQHSIESWERKCTFLEDQNSALRQLL
jgi:hypothetical protein